MPEWLRYLGFTASLPLTLVAYSLSIILTSFGLIFMFVGWTISFCTSCGCQYEKMREVMKKLNSIHFYIISCCTCDPLWSYETITENPTDLEKPQPQPSGTRSFTYEELAISTNNFSADNVLGEGGFSLVYKGTLTNGTEVAIKHLKDTHRQPDLEFMKEVDILSSVHHRHLVSLIGFYISEQICLLVCEYIPNKTLEFHLHGRNGSNLAWQHRFRISLDMAKGLEYLHEHCNPRVIHRDIKAANILLDHQFRAKIADFGIAKHFSDEKTHISTIVKGTYGYLAPEYASTGQLTDKSDVYSYGVLLLELITGQKPVGLADWARPLLQQAMENGVYDVLIDPFLDNNYSPVEAGTIVACASACLYRAAALRPSMSQIRRALEECISLGNRDTIQSPLG